MKRSNIIVQRSKIKIHRSKHLQFSACGGCSHRWSRCRRTRRSRYYLKYLDDLWSPASDLWSLIFRFWFSTFRLRPLISDLRPLSFDPCSLDSCLICDLWSLLLTDDGCDRQPGERLVHLEEDRLGRVLEVEEIDVVFMMILSLISDLWYYFGRRAPKRPHSCEWKIAQSIVVPDLRSLVFDLWSFTLDIAHILILLADLADQPILDIDGDELVIASEQEDLCKL